MKRCLILIAAAALLVGCEGKQGATGPAGPKGDPGPGSRVVYQSTTPIPTEAIWTVSVPEITLDDMPMVAVYVAANPNEVWVELPWYVEGGPAQGTQVYLAEGEVIFRECLGFYYKIVIVT